MTDDYDLPPGYNTPTVRLMLEILKLLAANGSVTMSITLSSHQDSGQADV